VHHRRPHRSRYRHRGTGVKVNGSYKDFEQGSARQTYHPYDLMIDGKGFFPIQLPNGEVAYTRNGDFHKDAQGRMVMTNGAQLLPQITIPNNSGGLRIAQNGVVSSIQPDGTEAVIGQIQIVSFQNDRGLASVTGGVYKATAASGAPTQGVPGENGFGEVVQGSREMSNVDVASSMVEMIQTQRGYEMNTKVMSTADEMMKATVNVR
jgi:flagellar basal-body rod protein FlgG